MAEERICPQCGVPFAANAMEGLCPKCVGRAALDESSGPVATVLEAQTPEEKGAPQKYWQKPEESGDEIGQYKLLQQIGEGGFGSVWMADQERPVRRRVALKVIKLGMDTKEVIARFEQERQALAMMDHPNIAKVLDAGATQKGRPFFVMELVRGIKITEYCDQANLPTPERLKLFIQVCHAVQHAHQKGIIHRDIKPSNILVTLHDGVPVPKVIDFGVAKATQSQRLTDLTLFTQFEQMIGTPLYMSPEQAEMSGLDVDTRSDIYSLGVLLYELLTGRTPFDPAELMRKGYDEIRRVIREQEPKKPSTAVGTMAVEIRSTIAQHRQSDPGKLTTLLRGDLDWIVMKALEKDRSRRYDTATGLARDIERHLAYEPIHARPTSPIYRFRRLVKRNRLAFTAAGLVAAALIVGLGVATWSFFKEKEARQIAVAAKLDAETAATKSQQVAQFLQKMLKGAGPQVARDRDTKLLSEILDQTEANLANDLKGQPGVEAELRGTLAGIYHDLAEYDKAERMCREALRLNDSLGARALRELDARLLNQLCATLTELHRFPEAQKVGEEALALNRSVHGQLHIGVATSLHHLGEVLRYKDSLGLAEASLREALDQWTRLHAEKEPEAGLTLNDLGLVMRSYGNLPEAERLFREALAIRENHYESNHPYVAESLGNVGLVLWDQGRLQEAKEMHARAFAIREDVFKEKANHHDIANSCNNLSLVLRDLGELEEAEKLQTRALKIVGDALGDNDNRTIQTRNNLAIILRRKGASSGNLSVLRESLKANPSDVLTADAIANVLANPSLTPISFEGQGPAQPWKYILEQPDPNWIVTDFPDAAWKTDPVARGAAAIVPRTPKSHIPTHTDIWLRRSFPLTALPAGKLVFRVHSHQDAEIFINGVAAASTADWSDTDALVSCRKEASAALKLGTNVLAVHCQDTDGGLPIDVQLHATPDATFGREGLIKEFDRMIDEESKRADLYAGRAEARARLGRWKDAISDLEAARRIDRMNPVYVYRLGILHLYSGDRLSYDKLRRIVLQDFSKENPETVEELLCRLLLLARTNGDELALAERFSNDAITAEYPAGLAWRQLSKGLAECRLAESRRSNSSKAIEWIDKARETNARKALPGWTHERERNREASALFIAALSNGRDDKGKAIRAFEQGTDIARKQFPQVECNDLGREWHDMLFALILQREAEALPNLQTKTATEK